jgi:hypothetical protein
MAWLKMNMHGCCPVNRTVKNSFLVDNVVMVGSRCVILGDEIVLESVGLTLQVEDIYDRVKNEDTIEWLAAKL